ncbi:MAG: alpha-glucosidase [Treponemataceae bacterium]
MNEKKAKLTLESKISDVYRTPVGKDIISKILLQLGKTERFITNPLVSNLKLKTLVFFTKKYNLNSFFDSFLALVNTDSENDEVSFDSENNDIEKKSKITPQWWKSAVFYQIYPRSFCDSNGDDIGDIQGIISKLDYLKELGIDALWLSPIYDSPNDDNGYDIRDYKKIMTEFGDMKDFDLLLEQVHSRGMKLIMDLVVNHTSDEHQWFQKALEDKTSKYHNYYFFQDKPNNWTSFFSGSSWNFYEKNKEYALHSFSKKQMDLNWDNPELREDIIEMIKWWLKKGVDGFRMDVINFISKKPGLPDGNELIGKLMEFTGIEHYFYGPNLHKYFRQIRHEAFEPYKAFSVGETPGLGMQMARQVTSEKRHELDMIFNFDHLESPGHVRFDDYEYDLDYYKNYIINWMQNYGNDCWMSLFYNNHDNPKMVSKISKNKDYQERIQILLAVIQFTLKGTPFVFQGEEMGIANYEFENIEQIKDVESRNLYPELCKKMDKARAFEIIKAGSREHGRIPLPWNENSKNKLVKQQKINFKIMEIYKALIKLRHENSSLVYGDFEVLCDKKNRFTYSRTGENAFIIDCNLCKKPKKAFKVPENFVQIFLTENHAFNFHFCGDFLGPYEVRIYQCK